MNRIESSLNTIARAGIYLLYLSTIILVLGILVLFCNGAIAEEPKPPGWGFQIAGGVQNSKDPKKTDIVITACGETFTFTFKTIDVIRRNDEVVDYIDFRMQQLCP